MINFKDIDWYASRAELAYQSEEKIRNALPDVQIVKTTEQNVQYFLEIDKENGRQIIVIRGTDNYKNAWEDSEYVQSKNTKLGIWVHSGFDKDTHEIYTELLPSLDANLETVVTGHSLGAAISTLLMMYLHEDGFTLGRSINFGQPKVTNKKGVKKYAFLPLVRVVNEDDVVPLVPPLDLIDLIHGGYEHLGEKIILLREQFFVYLEEDIAEKMSWGGFWKNIGSESVKAHFIAHYRANIKTKYDVQEAVNYKDRKNYYTQY